MIRHFFSVMMCRWEWNCNQIHPTVELCTLSVGFDLMLDCTLPRKEIKTLFSSYFHPLHNVCAILCNFFPPFSEWKHVKISEKWEQKEKEYFIRGHLVSLFQLYVTLSISMWFLRRTSYTNGGKETSTHVCNRWYMNSKEHLCSAAYLFFILSLSFPFYRNTANVIYSIKWILLLFVK